MMQPALEGVVGEEEFGLGRARLTPVPGNVAFEAELATVGQQPAEGGVDLVEVTTSVEETLGRFAAAHDVTVLYQFPDHLSSVKVNRVALRQIELNVLGYLVDLVRSQCDDPKVSLVLRAERVADAVELTMWWEGSSTVDQPSRPIESAALLTAARYLAQLQNVAIDEVGDGRASLGLRLRLPVSDERSILVVDDNPDVGELFRRMLAKTSYRLVQVRTASRALAIARESLPAAIILDVVMPTQDGWEILTALQRDQKTVGIPVVVCSVLPDRELALSLGATDFLPKPVTRSALLRTLERLFRQDSNVG